MVLWAVICTPDPHVVMTDKLQTSLSATGITRFSAWVHLGNINYMGIKHQQEYITLCTLVLVPVTLQGLNTELIYFGI
jgi:hypothetical protein